MIRLDTFNTPRVLLFSVLCLLTLYVLVVSEYMNMANNPDLISRYQTMSWILVPHALLGMVALLMGPVQFSTTLRNSNLALHRRLGKIYIIAILLSALFSVLLTMYHPIPGAEVTFMIENITQASVWAVTAGMAWLAASRRQVMIHKMWAARSYGVTLVFVLSRIYNPMSLFVDKPDINDFTHFLWLLIVLALVIPDMLVFNKQLFLSRNKR
jgi:hypothetical protein